MFRLYTIALKASENNGVLESYDFQKTQNRSSVLLCLYKSCRVSTSSPNKSYTSKLIPYQLVIIMHGFTVKENRAIDQAIWLHGEQENLGLSDNWHIRTSGLNRVKVAKTLVAVEDASAAFYR